MPGIMDRNQNGYVWGPLGGQRSVDEVANANVSLKQDVWDFLEVRTYWRATQPICEHLLCPDGSEFILKHHRSRVLVSSPYTNERLPGLYFLWWLIMATSSPLATKIPFWELHGLNSKITSASHSVIHF